jgi:hypothetical protein
VFEGLARHTAGAPNRVETADIGEDDLVAVDFRAAEKAGFGLEERKG